MNNTDTVDIDFLDLFGSTREIFHVGHCANYCQIGQRRDGHCAACRDGEAQHHLYKRRSQFFQWSIFNSEYFNALLTCLNQDTLGEVLVSQKEANIKVNYQKTKFKNILKYFILKIFAYIYPFNKFVFYIYLFRPLNIVFTYKDFLFKFSMIQVIMFW